MSDHLIERLRELYVSIKKEALRDGQGKLVKIIFHRGGRHMKQNHIRRIFKRILSKAGLRDISLHDIRHSFASQSLTDGASPVYVKEQLGHSSINMTVDVCGHLIPGSNRDIVNRLDTLHQSLPYPHSEKIQKPQRIIVTAQN
jgi:integrase